MVNSQEAVTACQGAAAISGATGDQHCAVGD
jgi:hypothetical protein